MINDAYLKEINSDCALIFHLFLGAYLAQYIRLLLGYRALRYPCDPAG